MSIIPFNPKRANGTGQAGYSGAGLAGACPSGSEPQNGGTAEADGRRDRVEVLERALIAALRENAANWARAEQAERLLRNDASAEAVAD